MGGNMGSATFGFTCNSEKKSKNKDIIAPATHPLRKQVVLGRNNNIDRVYVRKLTPVSLRELEDQIRSCSSSGKEDSDLLTAAGTH